MGFTEQIIFNRLLLLKLKLYYLMLFIITGLLVGHGKKVKFRRIFRDKFAEKTADFAGNFAGIFEASFAEK